MLCHLFNSISEGFKCGKSYLCVIKLHVTKIN